MADEIKLPAGLLIPWRGGDTVEVTVAFRTVVPVPDDPSLPAGMPVAGLLADARVVDIYATLAPIEIPED